MNIEVTESRRLKRASACLRNGVIQVKLPQTWPITYKKEVIEDLVTRVLKKEAQDKRLVEALINNDDTLITLDDQIALEAFVKQINQETFQVSLGKIRIGQARYTRLAQVNLKTKTMTVSRFCLTEVPREALRYLIVHELAHFLEAGHTQRFWGIVAQFVPDYQRQSRLIKAYYRRAVLLEDSPVILDH